MGSQRVRHDWVTFTWSRNPLLGTYPETIKTLIWKDTYMPMFISVLMTIAKTWKQPKCSLTDEWIKKLWYVYTMEYCESHSVVSYSLWPHGLYHPWNSPGQNTGVGSLSFLQGIFPTQGLNPGLLHCGQILYQLSHRASPNGTLLSHKKEQISF